MASGINIYFKLLISRIGIPDIRKSTSWYQECVLDISNSYFWYQQLELL